MPKRLLVVSGIAAVGIAAAAIFLLRSSSARPEIPTERSPQAAEALQTKIDQIKSAATDATRSEAQTLDLYEAELESYVLFRLKDKIPVELKSFGVKLDAGTISSETDVTFTGSGDNSNPVLRMLVGSTHAVYISGKLSGQGGHGTFDLEEIRFDGIPVPGFVVQALIGQYVTPKYPDVDLNKPFEIPYGIEDIQITKGKATITY